MRAGIEIATILKSLYPQNFDPAKLLLLVGNDETILQLQRSTPPNEILANWSPNVEAFDHLRRKYFLYK
jgi:uncharacterized protein YbbC (DUF1343 family)